MVLFHGHDVSTVEACRRAAQIKVDLAYDGPMILFNWTVGFNLDYVRSKEGIHWSAPFATRTLDALCEELGQYSLDVFAHSAGSDLFVTGEVRNPHGACLDTVLLAAPDIAYRLFDRDFKDPLVKRSRRVILFYSSTDRALNASAQVNGYRRLGSGPTVPRLPPITTIDASRASTEIFGFRTRLQHGQRR